MPSCIMMTRIMNFLNRLAEMERLERLMALTEGGLAVVYGRRPGHEALHHSAGVADRGPARSAARRARVSRAS